MERTVIFKAKINVQQVHPKIVFILTCYDVSLKK